MAESIGVEFAALVVPVLALVAVFAIDSVKDDDKFYYRLFVGGLSLASLGPMLTVLALSVLSTHNSISPGKVTGYTLLSFFLVSILIIGITVTETARGLGDQEKNRFSAILGALVIAWYALLYYLP